MVFIILEERLSSAKVELADVILGGQRFLLFVFSCFCVSSI